MVRLTVLYGTPTDEAKFVEHYTGTHAPLVKKMEKLKSFTWGKTLPGLDGAAAPYFWTAELQWASPDDMMADFGSEVGGQTVADLANLPAEATTVLSEGN